MASIFTVYYPLLPDLPNDRDTIYCGCSSAHGPSARMGAALHF